MFFNGWWGHQPWSLYGNQSNYDALKIQSCFFNGWWGHQPWSLYGNQSNYDVLKYNHVFLMAGGDTSHGLY
jgi:hypothetical protein